MLRTLTNLFALWVVLGVIWAWMVPEHFAWFAPYIGEGLGMIMLGMGLTLRLEDFREALERPRAIGVGLASQFGIMPALGFGVAQTFGLDPALAVGMILVSSCPGGTASNVISFLAHADLPLSILLTLASTMVSVALTPLLVEGLAGAIVPVDAWGMFRSMVTIVLLPLVVGVLLNRYASRAVAKVVPIAPLVSVFFIVLIVGCIFALQRDVIRDSAEELLAAIGVLHGLGFLLGYGVARLVGYPEQARRTLAIEVGMQNSGLGAALAKAHFAATPLTAVPAAISAVVHCLYGSLLASVWRLKAAV